jgi:hypothetical protein
MKRDWSSPSPLTEKKVIDRHHWPSASIRTVDSVKVSNWPFDRQEFAKTRTPAETVEKAQILLFSKIHISQNQLLRCPKKLDLRFFDSLA